ncbi:sigma 54-interacting transcriptional regulator [Aquincola sp. MAHUQ-54]|uniref:Sigma 54-interacting transcriptional regulator n=1 Tax=Aquincola agrisoli TaxID=3119538 RepID=A0AAW9QAP7_9BURK
MTAWPADAADRGESFRQLAMRSLFDRLEALCEGSVAVDREARVTWINAKYARRFGLEAEAAVGMDIEALIPHSRLREVVDSGRPIVLDIMDMGSGHCVVTRMPLCDEGGEVIGAIGFVLYDRVEGLKPVVDKVAQLQRRLTAAERELSENRRAKYSLASFIGVSPACTEIKRRARRAAQLDSTVLLAGETGTGKELLAHAIHNVSPRADKPFIGINAAAIPESLLEAELFGAAPGAYTGAERRGREGKFKLADGGTLFLDEVGDMPLSLQAKLLRVLQEREIEPLGANRIVPVDVRVIAATSVDLAGAVAQGRFRADLYYRLAVLQLAVPPLRERLPDLPLLAERLLDDIGSRIGQPLELADDALAVLARHAWPGNVRELRNVLERAVLMFETPRLAAAHLLKLLPAAADAGPAPVAAAGGVGRLAEATAQAERQAIVSALASTGGNKLAAARLLGISRAALYQKLSVLGIGAPAAGAG